MSFKIIKNLRFCLNFKKLKKILNRSTFYLAMGTSSVVFDHEATATACLDEKHHLVNDTKVKIGRRKTTASSKPKTSEVGETRSKLNSAESLAKQIELLFECYKPISEAIKSK